MDDSHTMVHLCGKIGPDEKSMCGWQLLHLLLALFKA